MSSLRFEDAFEPEVASLIGEVMRMPHSSLFRWHSSTTISTRERLAQLPDSRLQHELDIVQRAELANLFRAAALIRLYSIPNRPHYLHRNLTINQKVYIPDTSTWRKAARDALMLGSELLDNSDRQLLEICIRDGLSAIAIRDLALASMRLQPTDPARIYLALDVSGQGQPRTALQILMDVARGPGGPIERSYAWEHIAFLYSQWDMFAEAVVALRAAAALAPDRADPLMNWLFNACLAGNEVEIRKSALLLDRMIDSEHSVITDYIQVLSDQARLNQWNLSVGSASLLDTMKNSLGDAPRAIINAMLICGDQGSRSRHMQQKGNLGIPPSAFCVNRP